MRYLMVNQSQEHIKILNNFPLIFINIIFRKLTRKETPKI